MLTYTGKLVPEKRPDLLVEAAARLVANGASVRVLLVGGGTTEYVEAMSEPFAAIGRTDALTIWPAVRNDELPAIYAATDVAVWPARSSLSMLDA